MRLPRECYQIRQTLEKFLPHLRRSQVTGLTLWVYGTLLARSGCQNAVVTALSIMSNGLPVAVQWNNLRQYLREWLYDGRDRASPYGVQLDVRPCFVPLLRWVLAWWESDKLVLAIDPTMKGDRINCLVISVVYRSCAIPISWCVLPANKSGEWVVPIMDLLKPLSSAVPRRMTVLVMCDRGLRSPRLWRQIRSLGWHPYMRQSVNTVFCPDGGTRLAARSLVPGPDHAYVGYGTAFRDRKKQQRGTIIVVWGRGQDDPWIVLTSLPPEEAGACWYALRFWIEVGFKSLKSVGWQWQKTRREDPGRVSRHWLVLSVATLWALAYGTRAEDANDLGLPPGRLRRPPQSLPPNHRANRGTQRRIVSVLQLGISCLTHLLRQGRLWRKVWLLPEPWPEPPPNMKLIHGPYT